MPDETASAGPTKTTTFRFTADDTEAMDALCQHHGISTRADLVRFLVRREQKAIARQKPKKST